MLCSFARLQLFVRDDGTVDWDGAIQSGREVARFGQVRPRVSCCSRGAGVGWERGVDEWVGVFMRSPRDPVLLIHGYPARAVSVPILRRLRLTPLNDD